MVLKILLKEATIQYFREP